MSRFFVMFFPKVTLSNKNVWKFISEGVVNEWSINVNCFFFIIFVSLRPYLIVWICVFHKKVTHLDIFLNELCSRCVVCNILSSDELWFMMHCEITDVNLHTIYSICHPTSHKQARFKIPQFYNVQAQAAMKQNSWCYRPQPSPSI